MKKLHDEIEGLRISCDKSAKTDRDTKERFGFLEKHTHSLGLESDRKIGALENQIEHRMSEINGTLTRSYSRGLYEIRTTVLVLECFRCSHLLRLLDLRSHLPHNIDQF